MDPSVINEIKPIWKVTLIAISKMQSYMREQIWGSPQQKSA